MPKQKYHPLDKAQYEIIKKGKTKLQRDIVLVCDITRNRLSSGKLIIFRKDIYGVWQYCYFGENLAFASIIFESLN
jgi:hypothetical protein